MTSKTTKSGGEIKDLEAKGTKQVKGGATAAQPVKYLIFKMGTVFTA
jgi:hypothetical protein